MTAHDSWSAGRPLTTAEARDAGYAVVRGAYRGTTDDRLDRWYIERTDSRVISRLGSGYSTRADALWALTERLAADEAMDSQVDMVDVTAIARRTGRTVGAVHQLRRRNADFPAPIVTLATGPVWAWSVVERWAAIPRPTGRPRKER